MMRAMPATPERPARLSAGDRITALLLLLSGAAALVDEHLLSRLLVRVVGSSSESVAAVLVAFIGGMGIGARLMAGRVSKLKRPFLTYAAVEIGVGLSALAALPLTHLAGEVFVSLASGLGGGTSLMVARFVFAVLLATGPGILMGTTLPILLEAVRRWGARPDRPLPLPYLYSANTLGGALGVLSSTYVLVPTLGLTGTLIASASGNLLLAAFSLLLATRPQRSPGELSTATEAAPAFAPPLPLSRGVVIAFASGLLAFALETLWFRLLGVVAGNSVYAFGLMLFVFLLGNAIGSRLAEHRALLHPRNLPLSQAMVGLATLGMAPFWDDLPPLFQYIGNFAPSWALWEGTRALAALLLLILPTVAMGAAFGLLLRNCGGGDAETPARVARLYAANTMGAIGGALLGTFILAPMLGSETALRLVGLAEVGIAGLALVPAVGTLGVRRGFAGGLGAVAVLTCVFAPTWDASRMLAGTNVYFSSGFQGFENLRFFEEDRTGGMVAVIEQDGQRTLIANAKFEGNDGFEVPDQQMFALLPMLFVKRHDRALNIGVGTANTLATMAAFPFTRLDAVDLSSAVLDAARQEFAHLNDGVLDDPRVHVYVEDGRNFLDTSDARYDVVSIQLSSIWIGGTADLYNREFYETVRAHITPDGVLKQWLQLHHISAEDMARVMGTMQAVFPYVTLWVAGYQGVLVGSQQPLVADARRLDAWVTDPRLGPILKTSGMLHPWAAFGHLYLDEKGIAAFIEGVRAEGGLPPEALISRDDRPSLEYSTPRGNLLRDALGANMERLRRFATVAPLNHVTGLAGDTEKRIFLGYAAHERGFPGLARMAMGAIVEGDAPATGPHAALIEAVRQTPVGAWP
jgi:spermidine synthase